MGRTNVDLVHYRQNDGFAYYVHIGDRFCGCDDMLYVFCVFAIGLTRSFVQRSYRCLATNALSHLATVYCKWTLRLE